MPIFSISREPFAHVCKQTGHFRICFKGNSI